ncbi:MAG TPA: LiaF domain-containing protein [Dongiaceae bacterium]|nr:LiaF domain-containing protein [Dongiaceae bacterium]
MSVQSQAGPGAYGGQQGPSGAQGGDGAVYRPGYGSAIAAFGLLVLIAAGSVRYMREHQGPVFENSAESSSGKVDAVAVMGEKRVTSLAGEFRSADAVGVMGHCILDLRQATMQGDTATIDAVAVMGQVEIFVPPDWIVLPDDVLTVGSLVNRARHSDAPNPRTVNLTGAVLMGEIQVRR